MVEESAEELVHSCISAMRGGADFPTIWETVLKGHALVMGPPIQAHEDGRVCLKVPLSTRQWLKFESSSQEFSLAGRWSWHGF
jgi:hypothetical protein